MNSVLYESENITLDPLEKEFDNVAVISGNLLTRVRFCKSPCIVTEREMDTLSGEATL